MTEKIKVTPTSSQKILNIVSAITVIAYIIYCVWVWDKLPEMIPRHYNVLGEIDAYWSKNHFFFLPAITVFLYVFMSLTERFPQMWNIPQKKSVDITTQERNLSLAYSMILVMKLEIVLIFGILTFYTATNQNTAMWFLGAVLAILLVTMWYYVRKMKAE